MSARLFPPRVTLRYVAAALLALSLTGAQPAAAQTLPQASPASILLAKQILDLKDVKGVFQPIIRGVVIKSRDLFMQTNFMLSKDLNECAIIVDKQYQPRVNELVDASARIYASHFTEQELKDLLTFYQSPLGKKAIAEEPKALDQSISFAGTWADKLSEEVINSLRAEMKKRGHDI
ncbi:MAG TPA: DUF2059 domain-containing protein [Xanthobacteraceae bacterium]|jgi:hypothetical protein|nr:DUF2059 domain-containing protein [Xanthobacteraceae bacterium]